MDKEIKNRRIMFGRVLTFLERPDLVLPAGGQALVTELTAIETRLEDLGGDQVAATGKTGAGVASRFQTAVLLRADVRAVADVARRLDPVQHPGVAEQFKAPKSNSYTALTDAARAIVDEMEVPIRTLFIARLGQELLDRIPVLLTQFETNTGHKDGGRNDQVASTAALKLAAARGLAIVRELDPVVRFALRARPELIAAWKSASHVQRRVAAEPTPTPTPEPNPAPAPAPVTAS